MLGRHYDIAKQGTLQAIKDLIEDYLSRLSLVEARLPSFEDYFERADGPLGTSPTGHPWIVTGNGTPVIIGRQMAVPLPVGATNRAGYAIIELDKVSPSITTRFVVRPGAGGPCSTVALLVNQLADAFLTNTVHLICTAGQWSIQVIDGTLGVGGVGITTLASGLYPVLPAGEYEMSATIEGDTVTLIDPYGGEHSVKDPRFGRFWGKRQCYEIQHRPNEREARLTLTSARVTEKSTAGVPVSFLESIRTAGVTTAPRGYGSSAAAMTSGTIYSQRALVHETGTYSRIRLEVSTAFVGLTDFRVALCDLDGDAQAQSPSDTNLQPGYKVFNIGSSVTLRKGQEVLLAAGGLGQTAGQCRSTFYGSSFATALEPKLTAQETGWAGGPFPAKLNFANAGLSHAIRMEMLP